MGNETEEAKGKSEEGKEFDAQKSFTELSTQLKTITEQLKTPPKSDDDFDPEKLLRELSEDEGKERGKEPKEGNGEIDLEKMSPKDFVTFVLTNADKRVQAALQPVIDRIEVVRVRGEVADCKERYPDFMDHKKEIFALAMRKPELSVEEAYLQVVGKTTVSQRDKDRAEKAEKEKAEKEREASERAASKGKLPFFGERGGPSRKASHEAPENIRGAAELALKDVLGETGE